MKHRPLFTALAALAIAAGCAQPSVNAPQHASVLNGPVTAIAKLAIDEARSVLALQPWRLADIDHIEVSLYRDGATEPQSTQTVSRAQLYGTVTFANLHHETAYRVTLKAWSDAAKTNRIDKLAVDASSCTTSFTTTRDDSIDVGALTLTLADRTVVSQRGVVTTLAGDGSTAIFNDMQGIAVDDGGTVYLADSGNNRIRTIDASGVVTTLDGGDATAGLSYPTGVAVDGSGTVYVADRNNHLIRKIDSEGAMTTLAGDGTTAVFNQPFGVAVDGSGNVYVADTNNNRVCKVTPDGAVSTLAGEGTFIAPQGVAVDGSGNLYVADTGNNLIRKIDADGVLTTFAGDGTSTEFDEPQGVVVDRAGNVYVADSSNHRIRKIDSDGQVTTLAGSGAADFLDGAGTAARFNSPQGVAVDASGHVYVGDTVNNRVRKIR